MVDDGTHGIGAAHGRGATGVGAAVAEAGLVGCAVLIGTAADHTDVVEADVTQEAVVVQAASQHAGSTDALLILGTGTVPCTSWVTHAIIAEEPGWAVAVPLTSCGNPVTLDVRLAGEARRAGTHLLVVDHIAYGVQATGQLLVAQVGALTSLAGLRQSTLAVTLTWRSAESTVTDGVGGTVSIEATGNLLGSTASYKVGGISLVTLNAGADGAVVDGATVRVGATQRSLTHILTLGYVVFLATVGRGWAVRVNKAINWLFTAFVVSVAYCTWGTDALVVASEVVAAGTWPTRLLSTEVNRFAALEGIALEPIATEAHGLVVLGDAQSIVATLVVDPTGNFAHVVVASFVLATLLVPLALDLPAANSLVHRVAKVTLRTLADGFMVDGHTLGTTATQGKAITGSLALGLTHSVSSTLLTCLAIRVLAASDLRHTDFVLAHLEIWTISASTAGRNT